jgi:hypothetical protein
MRPLPRDVAPASWIAGRLHAFGRDIRSVIPEGYAAYARVFHPVTTSRWRRERWTEIARRNGRIAHPEMQFHMIRRPVGQPAPGLPERGDGPSWGSLPPEERSALVDLLRPATGTPERCWFCVWDGWADLDDHGVPARVELPGRTYLLAVGPLELATSSICAPPFDRSPNLWWPDDREWFVATEVDFAWTYVGGPESLIERVLADERLEALPARLTDKPFYDSDLVNAALDRV